MDREVFDFASAQRLIDSEVGRTIVKVKSTQKRRYPKLLGDMGRAVGNNLGVALANNTEIRACYQGCVALKKRKEEGTVSSYLITARQRSRLVALSYG